MRLTTGILLWVVAAAAATAVGLAAVAAIGTDIFGGGEDPLSQSQVDELLASQAPSTSVSVPPSSTSATPPPSPPPVTEYPTVTGGGTVIARCDPSGLVQVLSAAPAQGWQVDADDDELDDHPSVKFESGEQEIEVRLRCVNGIPQAEVRDGH